MLIYILQGTMLACVLAGMLLVYRGIGEIPLHKKPEQEIWRTLRRYRTMILLIFAIFIGCMLFGEALRK